MTQTEFLEVYSELAEHFGPQAFSGKRGKLIFENIKELPKSWWRITAHKMILANDGRFDIYNAAKAELGAIRWQQRTDQEVGAIHNFSRNMSEAGFKETLNSFGAKSLWEAIEKKKERGA